MEKNKTALVVQGGSLRSIFTCGVLDAFIENEFDPFDSYYSVSGGSMCASYYLTGQVNHTRNIILELSQQKEFISIRNFLSTEGYLNLDYLEEYSQKHYPLDIEKGLELLKNKHFEVVATNLENGEPVYLKPNKDTWMKCLRASATLPFVTRGVTEFNDLKLMDGGWGDPVPAKRAVEHGATKVIVIRTQPTNHRSNWTYLGWIAGIYHRYRPGMAKRFKEDHIDNNLLFDFLENPPEDIDLVQIAPDEYLKTGNYSSTTDSLEIDYLTGYQAGQEFLMKHGKVYQ